MRETKNFSGGKSLLFLTITAIFCMAFTGCGTTYNESTKLAADSIEINSTKINEIPSKKAVVIKLQGKVSENWVDSARAYFEDNAYDAIVLWIDSPGGGVTTTKIVAHKLKFLKDKYQKPLYIFTERYLASGAYWIACVADKIIAAPCASVGSIGVYIVRWDARGKYLRNGTIPYFIPSDSNKIRGSDATEFTERERTYWQERVNALHSQFITQIWENRITQLTTAYMLIHDIPLPQYHTTPSRKKTIQENSYEFLRTIANGTMYNSEGALISGLIDQCLYFDQFVTNLHKDNFVVYNTANSIINDLYVKPNSKEKNKTPFWYW